MDGDAHYYFREGVRRAVAARELGLEFLQAVLEIEGQPDRKIDVPLDRLHSPKGETSASDPRYRNVLQGLSTESGRMRMPAIAVAPLGTRRQSGSIPLSEVRLEP